MRPWTFVQHLWGGTPIGEETLIYFAIGVCGELMVLRTSTPKYSFRGSMNQIEIVWNADLHRVHFPVPFLSERYFHVPRFGFSCFFLCRNVYHIEYYFAHSIDSFIIPLAMCASVV